MREKLISVQPEVVDKVLEGIEDINLKKRLAKEIKLVDYPQIDNSAKFEWGETKVGIKMAQRYVGLDSKKIKIKISRQQLMLGNDGASVRAKAFSQQLSELKSSAKPYQRTQIQSDVSRQTPTMFESMPDLTKTNSDDEMAKNYMKIEAISKVEPTKTPQMPSQSYSTPTR